MPRFSSKKLKAFSFAKINWHLEIILPTQKGYHLINTVLESISLADILTFEKTKTDIILNCNLSDLPCDDRNLVYRAATLLRKYANTNLGVKIYLKKNIPLGAGLGGGSSNAAATLRVLSRLWNLRLSLKELCALALQIGCDVPFNLTGGVAVATNFGERLSFYSFLPRIELVLVKPKFDISTKWAYAEYDRGPTSVSDLGARPRCQTSRPDLVIKALKDNNLSKLVNLAKNDLEKPVFLKYPRLQRIKEEFIKLGADLSLMTGSGSAIFGASGDKKVTQRIYRHFKKRKDLSVWKVKPVMSSWGQTPRGHKSRNEA